MKLSKSCFIAAFAGLFVISFCDGAAAVPTSNVTYMPNNHGKSVTTPVAWGASGNVMFAGIGGTVPSPYSNKADGAAVLGAGFGDPKKCLGLQVCIISLDITEWKEYSSSFQIFREFDNASAVGLGVENVMLTDGGDAGKSYYVVYSKGLQYDSVVNKEIRTTKLHYSIGAGTNRYGDKSPIDTAYGKGKHGTYAFGNIAYEVANSYNIIADWNGLNLNAGVSKSFTINKIPFAIVLGAADLTRYSGDGVRFVCAGGFGFKL